MLIQDSSNICFTYFLFYIIKQNKTKQEAVIRVTILLKTIYTRIYQIVTLEEQIQKYRLRKVSNALLGKGVRRGINTLIYFKRICFIQNL